MTERELCKIVSQELLATLFKQYDTLDMEPHDRMHIALRSLAWAVIGMITPVMDKDECMVLMEHFKFNMLEDLLCLPADMFERAYK